MTAPVRTIAARFTAEGSEAVKRAVEQVSASARSAAERTAAAAAKAAARTVEVHNINAAMWQRSVQAAERAAHAEAAAREQAAQRIVAARQRETVAAERAAAAQVQSAARASTAIATRYGNSARAVAASFDAMAHAGRITGEAVRTMVTQSANMALMFSPTGPIVAAVGIAAISIVNLFANARAERKKLEEEAIAGLERLVNAGDLVGIRNQAREMWQGTPAKDFRDGLGPRLEALGLPFATRQILEDELAKADRLARTRVAGMKARAAEIRQVIELRRRYDDLAAAIARPSAAPRIEYPVEPITITPGTGPDVRTPRVPALPGATTRVGTPDFADRIAKLITPRLPDPTPLATKSVDEIIEAFRKTQSTLALGISDAIVGGIAGGITAAISSGSIGEALRAMTASVLAGLGDMFAQIAVRAIAMSKAMIAFQAFLTANPVVALAAAVGMMALARSMGGGRGGARGVVGGIPGAGAAASATTESATRIVFGAGGAGVAAGMTPRQFTNVTVIGPDDPRAQRAITELIRKAEGRGLRSSEQ